MALATAKHFLTNIGANCDSNLNIYTVSTFNVTPWPPSKNTNMSMNMVGVMNQATTLKAMDIFVFFNGANFYQETIPESGTYAAGQTATINFKVYIPSIAPTGNYAVQVKLVNTAGVYLNCWQVMFNL
jgi:hypothetical protein